MAYYKKKFRQKQEHFVLKRLRWHLTSQASDISFNAIAVPQGSIIHSVTLAKVYATMHAIRDANFEFHISEQSTYTDNTGDIFYAMTNKDSGGIGTINYPNFNQDTETWVWKPDIPIESEKISVRLDVEATKTITILIVVVLKVQNKIFGDKQ